MSGSSPRNAIAMSIGWWYLRRLIRKRGAVAVAGLLASEGLSLARPAPRRGRLRRLVLLGLVAAAVVYWWQSAKPEPTAT
jgi:hypothetical protein